MKTPDSPLFKKIDEFCEELDLDNYDKRELIMKVVQKMPQVIAVLNKWREDAKLCEEYQYSPRVSFAYDENHNIDMSNLAFTVNREFNSHEDLINWCKKHLLILPKKSEKSAVVVNGEAVTTLSYKIIFGDTSFVVSYKRKGLPGRKCRIESSVIENIVCDLS